ncbi:MAG: hypothetical protein QXG39_08995 [Candidatus Aenigmatarchaeota archaeon]
MSKLQKLKQFPLLFLSITLKYTFTLLTFDVYDEFGDDYKESDKSCENKAIQSNKEASKKT